MDSNTAEVAARLKTAVRIIVEELVDVSEAVVVSDLVGSGGNTIVLSVSTDPSDVGKVIGKKGQTATAIRGLLEAIAAKHRIKILLEIEDGRRRQHASEHHP